MDYDHTQQVSGAWLTSVLVVSSGPGVVVPIALGSPAEVVIPWAILAFLLVLVVLRSFSALTVTVTSECLQAAFRWGWPRKPTRFNCELNYPAIGTLSKVNKTKGK